MNDFSRVRKNLSQEKKEIVAFAEIIEKEAIEKKSPPSAWIALPFSSLTWPTSTP